MLLRISAAALAAALLMSTTASATTIGAATTIDPAVLHAGTSGNGYAIPWSSGGGLTGVADGTNWAGTGETRAQALSSADHHWAQFGDAQHGGAIWFNSAVSTDAVVAVPAIDHGWTAGNAGVEFYEPFEFLIFGCSTLGDPLSCTRGTITDVWALGVSDTGANKNADDWTSRWYFGGRYFNYFMVTDGDRLVGGAHSLGEGEIDALLIVPEPNILVLIATGLLSLFGFAAARRRADA